MVVMVPEAGLEPAPCRVKPAVLPLNYPRRGVRAGVEPAPCRSQPAALPLSYLTS